MFGGPFSYIQEMTKQVILKIKKLIKNIALVVYP